MDLLKCDKCRNRNIMCCVCEKNKQYIETDFSHDVYIRNKAIDDFANVLKENYDYLPQILSQEAFGICIDEYAEKLKADIIGVGGMEILPMN